MKNPWLPPKDKSAMLDLAELGLPEVPLVGIHNLIKTTRGLGEHVHTGTMEICYLRRGERIYQVGGKDYVLKGNDIFITFPDEVHGSGLNPHGRGVLYWMNLRLPVKPQAFLGLTADAAWPLVEALRNLPSRHFKGRRRLRTLFEEVLEARANAAAELKKVFVAAALVQWLRVVIDCSHASGGTGITDDIRRVQEQIAAHPEEPFVLSELADSIHLSLSRFKVKFKEQAGMPPWEFILRKRIERARTLLASGKFSVTDVAYRVQFSSSQYFATVFKRFTNMRPSEVSTTKG
jgi:AraC-like DNA-binding protein